MRRRRRRRGGWLGPVVAIVTYDSLDDALAIANDTEYGLQAAIFTSAIAKGLKFAIREGGRTVGAGTVTEILA